MLMGVNPWKQNPDPFFNLKSQFLEVVCGSKPISANWQVQFEIWNQDKILMIANKSIQGTRYAHPLKVRSHLLNGLSTAVTNIALELEKA